MGNDSKLYAWQRNLHEIIFEADTRAGKAFDLLLIFSILLSVLAVTLDSVASIKLSYGGWLYGVEWFFTIIFTIEYLLRILSIGKPIRYIFSFFGMVDLLAVIPTYLSLFVPGSQYFIVIRILRVLRVFRVLKLVQYLSEAQALNKALYASRRKIIIFLFTVLTLIVILGSLMYLVEGPRHGFTSIPRSLYWAIVTLTTVGYGDIAPQTNLGQALAALVMVLGYSIIAIPTGIVTVEMSQVFKQGINIGQSCPQCSAEGHADDAHFCKYCGAKL